MLYGSRYGGLPTNLTNSAQAVVSTACTPCRSLSSGVKQFGELFQLVALKNESDHVRGTVLTRA